MTQLRKRPSALTRITLSGAALATVIVYVTTVGTARQADEGAADRAALDNDFDIIAELTG